MDVLQGIGEMLFLVEITEEHPECILQFLAEGVVRDLESADGDLQFQAFFHLRQRQHLLEQGDDDQLGDVGFEIFLFLWFIDQLQFYVIIDHSRCDDALFLGGVQETQLLFDDGDHLIAVEAKIRQLVKSDERQVEQLLLIVFQFWFKLHGTTCFLDWKIQSSFRY
ncbi:hypothetical protein SDC9_146471 [bioreactor metagenome]|uniref:Uncharacterized protein n=1 Tax=bioreactor metagenome TaxID=1076179 RepID=A0A645EBQ9_9ZZZZ